MQNTTTNHSIHRFNLKSAKATLTLPSGAIITGFAPSSHGGFNIWALVCTDEGVKTEKRAFAVAQVGQELPAAATVADRPVPPLVIPVGMGKVTCFTLFEIDKASAADWKAFGC